MPDDVETRAQAALDAGALADAATLVVSGYGPEILGYLAALLRDEEAARDAFSEFGEEMWKALPRFARKSTLKTWAYAIAHHCALRDRRRRARRRTRALRDSELSRIAASIRTTPGSAQSFALTEATKKLDALRRALAPEEQSLLVLRIDRGMAWDEIAQVLGEKGPWAPAALRKRFQRLKERLRRAAEREGLLPRA